MQTYDVHVLLPPNDDPSDIVKVNHHSYTQRATRAARYTSDASSCRRTAAQRRPQRYRQGKPPQLHTTSHTSCSLHKRRELMQTYDVHVLLPPNDDPSDIVKVNHHSYTQRATRAARYTSDASSCRHTTCTCYCRPTTTPAISSSYTQRATRAARRAEATRAHADVLPPNDDPSDIVKVNHHSYTQRATRAARRAEATRAHADVLPPNDDPSDIVKVTGTPTNVEKAKQALTEKISEMEKEKEDRLLRSYELKFKVDPEYHPLVIGKGGAVITKIRTDFGVNINLPKRGEPDDDIITVQGYEDKAHQAKDAIMAIVHQLDNQYREEVDIDPRVHRRLIGLRGKNIRRIMDEYKVDIRFPKNQDDSLVIIAGDEDNVLDAKEHLLNLAEEYLQDVSDRYTRPAAPSLADFSDLSAGDAANANSNASQPPAAGFVVKGGPWEQRAPDTASTQEIPTETCCCYEERVARDHGILPEFMKDVAKIPNRAALSEAFFRGHARSSVGPKRAPTPTRVQTLISD
ncbi:KH domain-containing protein [Phthorimaea operculella]|nr:KH domain-containing protein [Phthorimaea operculella]